MSSLIVLATARIEQLEAKLAAAEAELAAIEHQPVVEHEHAGVEGRHAHRSYGEWRELVRSLRSEKAYSSEREEQPNMRLTKAQSKALIDDLGLSDLNSAKQEGK